MTLEIPILFENAICSEGFIHLVIQDQGIFEGNNEKKVMNLSIGCFPIFG